MKVKLLNPIEGFSDVAEYRCPFRDEWILTVNGAEESNRDHSLPWIVLTPIQKWREATNDDISRVMNGETVVARFRDNTNIPWKEDFLIGYIQGEYPWQNTRSGCVFCEVQA